MNDLPCQYCNGSGVFAHYQRINVGTLDEMDERLAERPCDFCYGTGRMAEEQRARLMVAGQPPAQRPLTLDDIHE